MTLTSPHDPAIGCQPMYRSPTLATPLSTTGLPNPFGIADLGQPHCRQWGCQPDFFQPRCQRTAKTVTLIRPTEYGLATHPPPGLADPPQPEQTSTGDRMGVGQLITLGSLDLHHRESSRAQHFKMPNPRASAPKMMSSREPRDFVRRLRALPGRFSRQAPRTRRVRRPRAPHSRAKD